MKSAAQDAVKSYRRKCDYLEIRLHTEKSTSLSLATKEVDSIKEKLDSGGCVRVLKNGAWGFSSFTNPLSLKRAAEDAFQMALAVGGGDGKLVPVEPVTATYNVEILNGPFHIPLGRKMDLLWSYNERILSGTGPTWNSRVSYFDSVIDLFYLNSEGTRIDQHKLDVGVAIVAMATKNGHTESSHISRGSSNDYSVVLGLEDEIDKSCRLAGELLDAPTARGGITTVICDPKLSGVFIHEAFGHTSEADHTYKDPELMKIMKIGAVFGSPILNVYDTGLSVGTRGHVPYDDEGLPAEKTYLIENGVLVGRLHTRETAAIMNERPTGNARAINFRNPPICRMRDTCIEQGETDPEEMIANTKDGIYAVDAHGGIGGEHFTFAAAHGYVIKNGKLGKLLKGIKIMGNLFKTLKEIDAVGNDFVHLGGGGGCGKGGQFPLGVGLSSPHIRIRSVLVGGGK